MELKAEIMKHKHTVEAHVIRKNSKKVLPQVFIMTTFYFVSELLQPLSKP
jgi:hypothetical protein